MKRLFVMMGMCAIVSGSVSAQAIAATTGVQSNAQTSIEKISVSFENTPLKEAIWTIAKRAGVRVTFDGKILPAKEVTYSATNVTPESAFAAILTKTGIAAERAPNGVFELVKVASRNRSATGVVIGKITDLKSGKNVSGATVSIGGSAQSATSDADGAYRITGIAAGNHVISVRLLGYAKQTKSVVLGDGATVTVDFKLEPSASVLNEVVVTGTVVATELKAVPNAITVITAKQIEERGITRIDQLFRGEVPGLFSLNRGSQTLLDEVIMFSRGPTSLPGSASAGVDQTTGGNTNPIKTYIDGVELADPKYLSQIDPRSIERIEILTGPQASTIYGSNALNGVMQIFTKRGGGSTSRPQLNLNLRSGFAQNNYNNHIAPSHLTDARLSGLEGRLSYNVGGSWDYTGAWTPSRRAQRLSVDGSSRMDMGKFSFDMSARQGHTKNKQGGSQFQAETELQASGMYAPTAGQGIPRLETATLDGRTIGVSVSYRPYSWWSHDIRLGRDAIVNETMSRSPGYAPGLRGGDTTLFINQSTNSRTSESYTTTIQVPIVSFGRLIATLGGDHWRSAQSSLFATGTTLTGSLSTPDVTRIPTSKNAGAYMQGQLALRDALFLTYGLRAEWNPNIGDEAKVLPGRYGVSYTRDLNTPLGDLTAKFRASYGRSIRPPQATIEQAIAATYEPFIDQYGQFDTQLSNEYLVPEHKQGGEGGLELYLGNRASVVITRFNETVDNLIFNLQSVDSVRSLTNTPDLNLCWSLLNVDVDGYCYMMQSQYVNAGSIRNQGWEFTGNLNMGPFVTQGTYSWTKSRVLGVTPRYRSLLFGAEFQAGASFDFVPEHTWALGVTYSRSASTVSLFINGIAQRYVLRDDLIQQQFSRLSTGRYRFSAPSDYQSLGKGYATADLNMNHRLSPRMDAMVQISNLTNYYQNDFSAQFASIGRQTRLGLRIRR